MAKSTSTGTPRGWGDGSVFSRFAGEETGLRETSLRRSPILRWILLGGTTLFLLFLFPHGTDTENSREAGSIWSGDTVRADFSFPLLKDPTVYNAEVQAARDSTLPVFVPTADFVAGLVGGAVGGLAGLASSALHSRS